RDTLLPALAYASRRVPEISDHLADVDHAMEWGFGQGSGPVRLWDQLGVGATVERMRALGLEVGGWVRDLLDAGGERFYVTVDGGEQGHGPGGGGAGAGAVWRGGVGCGTCGPRGAGSATGPPAAESGCAARWPARPSRCRWIRRPS